MAIAITLPGFNDLGRSVTPIFLLMDHFLYRFSTFSEKKEENLSTRSLNFLQNTPLHCVFLALRLFVQSFQIPLEGLNFVKTLAAFGIIYATDPLLQNMIKVVCLR